MGLTGGNRLAWTVYGAICLVLTIATIAALVVFANPGSPTAATAASGPARCASSQLAVTLGEASGALGHIGQVVHFRNRSSVRCTLHGYPGVQMLDAAGTPIPTTVRRGIAYTVPRVPERVVTLARGAKASFDIGYADATGYGNEQCPTSARVAITPPNDAAALTIAWRLQPYGGDIPHLRCGEITVSPVFAG